MGLQPRPGFSLVERGLGHHLMSDTGFRLAGGAFRPQLLIPDGRHPSARPRVEGEPGSQTQEIIVAKYALCRRETLSTSSYRTTLIISWIAPGSSSSSIGVGSEARRRSTTPGWLTPASWEKHRGEAFRMSLNRVCFASRGR